MSIATVTVTNIDTPVTTGGAAYASTTVTLTDSAGAVQTMSLNGKETPPYTAVFQNVAAVAGATGTVVAQAIDVNGAALGAPLSQTFTEIGSPLTFPAPTTITVTVA